MEDKDILEQISALVEREHQLRVARSEGSLDPHRELSELQATEVTLDQCWDLLRQRRARREFGEDVGQAEVRPADEVEKYLG